MLYDQLYVEYKTPIRKKIYSSIYPQRDNISFSLSLSPQDDKISLYLSQNSKVKTVTLDKVNDNSIILKIGMENKANKQADLIGDN